MSIHNFLTYIILRKKANQKTMKGLTMNYNNSNDRLPPAGAAHEPLTILSGSCHMILQFLSSSSSGGAEDGSDGVVRPSNTTCQGLITQESFTVATVIITILLAITVSKYIHERRKRNQQTTISSSSSNKNYRLPPLAPRSFIDSIKAATTGQLPFYLKDVCQEMGRVCRIKFMTPFAQVYITADPDISRAVLTDPTSLKSPRLKNFNQVTAGTTQFFTSNGYRYYHARKAMAPAFANNHIKRMDKVTVQKTEEWIQTRLESMVAREETIDINKEMVDLTLDVILEAAFEYNMSPTEKQHLMECLHITLKEFVFPNPLKMTFWFLCPSIWKARSKAKQLMSIAHNIIRSHRSKKDSTGITKGTVLDLIINNPNYNDDNERAADVIDLIVAGHETSSSSMTFLLLELAKNQQEQYKLQQILRSLKNQEERTSCEYLKHCIKEGLRKWPVGAVGPMRYLGRDFIIPTDEDHDDDDHNDVSKGNNNQQRKDKKDYYIPKGSIVFMPAIAILHSPKYFDRPLDFDPSRWNEPTDTMKHAFLPFSLGKRNCLGQSLANSEMQSILSRLCSQYNFELVEEGTVGMFITLKPIGVKLKATRIAG